MARPVLGLVLSGWLLFWLAELSPHLVHHAFKTDPESDCEILALAGHAPIDLAAAPVLPGPELAATRPPDGDRPIARPAEARHPPCRAPPTAPRTSA